VVALVCGCGKTDPHTGIIDARPRHISQATHGRVSGGIMNEIALHLTLILLIIADVVVVRLIFL
jgi:hypothetical protein